MLAQISAAHDELLSMIAELEGLVAGPVPDPGRLANVRWRLSRASRRRLRLMEVTIYPHLLGVVGAEQAERLVALRAAGRTQRVRSTDHVGKWNVADVIADWPGYRKASRQMTKDMRATVIAEKTLTYPFLGDSSACR